MECLRIGPTPFDSYEVEFRFQIVGLNGETRTSGTVQRKDGGSLTANIYRLEMRDGTTCRVMNNGGIWIILSSLSMVLVPERNDWAILLAQVTPVHPT